MLLVLHLTSQTPGSHHLCTFQCVFQYVALLSSRRIYIFGITTDVFFKIVCVLFATTWSLLSEYSGMTKHNIRKKILFKLKKQLSPLFTVVEGHAKIVGDLET
ncbi:hypothetical protein ACJX0J_005668 [Zea mays]